MPYITKLLRSKINSLLKPYLEDKASTTPGELNYTITKIIHHYLKVKGTSYTAINDIIGALEGAKLELYRRKVSEYENLKITENGDVD